jgi:phosphate acetyltransferase
VINMKFMENLFEKAKNNRKTIVLPEGEEERNIIAASKVLADDLASLVLLGNEDKIRSKAFELGVTIDKAIIVDPLLSNKKEMYAEKLYELRKNKGMTLDEAKEFVLDNVHFGIMMLKLGEVDGLVSGAIHTSGSLMKPSLQIIKSAPDAAIVSSFFIMMVPNCDFGDNGLLIFSDCGLNIDPTAEQLADIALQTAKTAKQLCNMEPRVALLSFSTKGSAQHELVDKVAKATEIAKSKNPSLSLDGELQLDAAIIPEVAALKAPDSIVAGHANILIFPNLDAGNIGYKLVERFGKAQAIGPLCQGFAKPVNDLSRGCSADDIVGAIIVTAVQAQTN